MCMRSGSNGERGNSAGSEKRPVGRDCKGRSIGPLEKLSEWLSTVQHHCGVALSTSRNTINMMHRSRHKGSADLCPGVHKGSKSSGALCHSRPLVSGTLPRAGQ